MDFKIAETGWDAITVPRNFEFFYKINRKNMK